MHLILYGDPRTKKNSARILKAHANRRIVAPSEAFMQYQEKCLRQIKRPRSPISARVNVRCVYYMATHDGSRVDYDKKNPRAEIWIEEMEVDT